jgi:hypothetical protein
MKFYASSEFDPSRVVSPSEYRRSLVSLSRGQVEVSPTTVFQHFITGMATSRAGYSVASMAIRAGLPVGPLTPFSTMSSAIRARPVLSAGRVLSVAANPIVAVPLGIVAATALYPEVAGPQYQSAISGQMSVGGGGHDLIYGNHERGSLSAVWNYFAQNF